MLIILHHWRTSLQLLSITQLFTILKQSCKSFAQGIVLLLRHFYWLLALDLLFFVISTRTMLQSLAAQKPGTALSLSPGALHLLLLMQGTAFGLSGILLLFIKKPKDLPSISYLKTSFLRYLQFYLLLSALLLVGIIFVTGLGITKFPMLNQPLLATFKIIEIVTLFYWLNSKGFFKSLLRSFESAINVIFYNLPLFILLGLLFFGINTIIQYCALGTLQADQAAQITTSRNNLLAILSNEKFSFSYLLIAKYLKFILEYFGIAIMLSIFEKKKDIRYTKTLFE